MSDRVTFLLPVRNAMPFLTEALASIEAQTYRNWEVLARDDGSTDGSLQELRSWIPSRIPGRVIAGQQIGVGGTLAMLTESATTELCARVDADDINLPERLELQTCFLKQHPKVAIVGGQMRKVSISGADLGIYEYLPLRHDDIVISMLHRTPIAHPTVLFRRSAVLQAGNYRAELFEDYDLWLRLAVRHKLANLNKELLRYRMHPDSTYKLKAALSGGVNQSLPVNSLRALYGSAGGQVGRLRDRRHPCAILPLLRIAAHIARTQQRPIWQIVDSQAFCNALAALTWRRDLISRAWLKIGSLFTRRSGKRDTDANCICTEDRELCRN